MVRQLLLLVHLLTAMQSATGGLLKNETLSDVTTLGPQDDTATASRRSHRDSCAAAQPVQAPLGQALGECDGHAAALLRPDGHLKPRLLHTSCSRVLKPQATRILLTGSDWSGQTGWQPACRCSAEILQVLACKQLLFFFKEMSIYLERQKQ